MRLSIANCAEKFFRKRDFIFTDSKFFRRTYVKGIGAGAVILTCMAFYVHEFCYPPPNVIYDFRRLSSPDFDRFVESNGLDSHDLAHRHQLQAFKYEEGQIKRIAGNDPVKNFG